jgi:signal transduction histidine kinase
MSGTHSILGLVDRGAEESGLFEAPVDEFAGLARAYAESQAFVALLAHELRTQLKAIERMLCASDGVVALQSTRSVQGLVESLLELARGEEGEQADTALAVRRVLDELDDQVTRAGAEIRVGNLTAVALPQALLETVLRNLIANALEAGASTVEVSARPGGAICVSDDGPGVPDDQAAKVFGIYSGKLGGAGVGLTLCREILRRRGGDIWLERPSTFAFQAAA